MQLRLLMIGTVLLLLLAGWPNSSFGQTAGPSEAIYTGTVRIQESIVDTLVVQLLNGHGDLIRTAYYNPVNGNYSVAAFSSDGFSNGAPIVFRIINHGDTIIAHPWGAPAVYNGTFLDPPVPPEPIVINLTNNHPPVFTSAVSDTAHEDTLYHYVMTANDADQDSLTFYYISGPKWLRFDTAAATLTGTPGAGDVGDAEVMIAVDDHNFQGWVTQMVIIHVIHTNHRPYARSQEVALDENTTALIELAGGDPDPNDLLQYVVVNGPSHGSIADTGNTPRAWYTPDHNYFGSDNFTFTVFDGQLYSDTVQVFITVRVVNHPPTTNNLHLTLDENTQIAFTLPGSDPDENDTLRFYVLTKPLFGRLSGDAPNLTYIPNRRFVGRDSVHFVVFDGKAYSETATVYFLVNFINHPPNPFSRIAPRDSTTIMQLGTVIFNWQNAPDPDGDAVFYIVRFMINQFGIDTSFVVRDTAIVLHIPDFQLPRVRFEVRWTVTATDGFAMTPASNDLGYFVFDNTEGISNSTGLPDNFALEQNYPNPFNPTTQIVYELPRLSDVRVTVYTMLGSEVRTLVDGRQGAGRYDIQWDGRNNAGTAVASGTYLCRIIALGNNGEPFTAIRKMTLMK